MRADIAEAVDAGRAHDAGGLLNTDWGDNGHLQYLPVSDPGLAYGAAMSWCAATNRDLDLGAALSAHCYDDPTGELGAIVVALGDVHRRLTPQVWNVASLVLPLYFPQLDLGRGPLQGARADEYDAVDADLDALEARLTRSGARRPDADLLAAELRNAMALVRVLTADARARLDVGGALGTVGAPARADLADALRPVITEHERLWLARNRPGGLARIARRGWSTCSVATRPASPTAGGRARRRASGPRPRRRGPGRATRERVRDESGGERGVGGTPERAVEDVGIAEPAPQLSFEASDGVQVLRRPGLLVRLAGVAGQGRGHRLREHERARPA